MPVMENALCFGMMSETKAIISVLFLVAASSLAIKFYEFITGLLDIFSLSHNHLTYWCAASFKMEEHEVLPQKAQGKAFEPERKYCSVCKECEIWRCSGDRIICLYFAAYKNAYLTLSDS